VPTFGRLLQAQLLLADLGQNRLKLVAMLLQMIQQPFLDGAANRLRAKLDMLADFFQIGWLKALQHRYRLRLALL
jgi:hypothetical protein